MARIIFLILFSLISSASAQEYLYPNKYAADRGLVEYRPYSLEEVRAMESPPSFQGLPFLTGWGSERRLTDQENIYTARAMAVGETILCSYAAVSGRYAFFVRSADAGQTWGDFVSLGDSLTRVAYDFPELARDERRLVVGSPTWHYAEMGYNLGYFASTDLGAIWEPLRTVFTYYRFHQSSFGSLANRGETLFFAYNEYDHDSLYVVRSTDWGETWNGRGANVAYLGGTIQNMCLRAGGGYLHLVWVNQEGTVNVRYSRSTDGGLTWGPEADIAEDPRGAQFPFVAVQDTYLVISWMGYKNGSHPFSGDLFLKRSFDNGASWDSAIALTDQHYVSRGTIHLSDSLLVAVWQDQRYADSLSNSEIFCRMSTDYGQSWGGEERVSLGNGDSFAPAATCSGPIVHVLWGDFRPEAPGLYYRRNDLLTGIGNDSGGGILPEKKELLSAYPNPFNSSVMINYSISGEKGGDICIYNIQGQLVRTFIIHGKEGSVVWDARDSNGSSLASGIYFARMSASGNDITRKLLYLK